MAYDESITKEGNKIGRSGSQIRRAAIYTSSKNFYPSRKSKLFPSYHPFLFLAKFTSLARGAKNTD
jgi:hypothetical protein